MDDGSEFLEGSGEDLSSFSLSCEQSSLLSSWLVEPGLDESLPVLAEMNVWKLIVVLNHIAN